MTINNGTRMTLAVLLILYGLAANAEIYQCVDASGKTVFSDNECAENSIKAKVIDPQVNVAAFKDIVGSDQPSNRPLYIGSRVGRKTRFLSVSIYEETDTYMIFKVEAYYSGPSNGRAEFRVMPNIHWAARSFSTSDVGVRSGYARVSLGSNAESGAVSDVITLQLWQYTTGESPKVLETKVVPYKKEWKKSP